MKSLKGKSFYITTAIDYVNSLPHIGTAYEKIGADVLARYARAKGGEVRFQMGNDEHSTNVIKAAKEKNLPAKEYCDMMRGKFESVWKKLNISYDDFIQTSEERHIKGVQELFQKIYDNGDIYKSNYEGWYCESCEAFYTEKDLVDGVCPNHKAKPKWIKEENYFFALSKYEKKLLDYIEKNPSCIEPEGRRNEVVSMIKQGLQDISISRAGFEWGIPVPFDKSHVVYVWFDALINYITAAGYGTDKKLFKKFWPADVHVIGKDIIRFHCVIWPAMLISAGIELPKSVFAHGFVYLRGEKMSKSLGNVVTPLDVIDKYGADSLRYYLLRGSPFGKDADFTWENFIERYNADLANGIGNLVSRTHGMISRYFGGEIKKLNRKGFKSKNAGSLKKCLEETPDKVDNALDFTKGELEFHNALSSIMELVSTTDRYINENPPWELAKKNELDRVSEVLGDVYLSIESIAELVEPFIPGTVDKIKKMMAFGGAKLGDSAQLFPRIEAAKETKIEPAKKEKKMEHKECKCGEPAGLTSGEPRGMGGRNESSNEPFPPSTIDITDFAKVQLKIAEVKTVEKVEGADKLLKLQIDLGGEMRQIVAGIAKHYTPESLVGKKIVVVANLKPAKLRGIESNGMLLAASDADSVVVLSPEKDIPAGSRVK